MRIDDASLKQLWEQGFTVIENVLDRETLEAAREALWKIFPRPEDYFADPSQYPAYAASQFSGARLFPYPSWDLNRVAVYPDLINAAERFLAATDIEIYKIELLAKYSGAVNYDQPHHLDFCNHSLVVPRRDARHVQMTTFILLSDVTELDGPTKLVPLEDTRHLPLDPHGLPFGDLFDKEVAATAPAGSILIYRTDVFHRGSDFTAPGRSRFALLVDFQERGWPWNGKMSWPGLAANLDMVEAMVKMTPRQRDLFGWPPAGSEYWNEQTLADVANRYPGIDLAPYRALAGTEDQ
jgi:hypothetical protein